jgi:prepilin-type N-terminal cleavage/methylation domain-containing protein
MKGNRMARLNLLSNESGFSLIEVLVAIAIFSVGLMAMGALQTRSLMETGDLTRKTEAWTIVDEQATLLKEMPFMNVPAYTVPADLTLGSHQVTHANGRYDIHWTVVDNTITLPAQPAAVLPGVPAGNWTVCKQITVQVTPVGGNPATDTIAEVQFLKTWWATGVP